MYMLVIPLEWETRRIVNDGFPVNLYISQEYCI